MIQLGDRVRDWEGRPGTVIDLHGVWPQGMGTAITPALEPYQRLTVRTDEGFPTVETEGAEHQFSMIQ